MGGGKNNAYGSHEFDSARGDGGDVGSAQGRHRAFRRGRCRAPASAACGTTTFHRAVSRRRPTAIRPNGSHRETATRASSTATIANSRSDDGRYRDRDYGVYDRTYPNDHTSDTGNRGYGYNSVPYDNGYRDGLEKGREDARDHDSFDPVRHSWYRSGDRGYNNRYGTRDSYKLAYRDGFEAGYDQAYRASRGYGVSRGARIPAAIPSLQRRF